ncbi:MAG: SDR family oxidoreductase [Marmoricola sp.]
MTTELPKLAVTGSTGALGSRIARRLAASDVSQRLLVRDASRVPRLDGATPVEFTGYADHASAVAALDGVKTLFMVSASENADRLGEHRAFVDAAAEAGVRHVVYTSFHGAAPDSTFTLGRDHYRTEEHIKASGMDWTFLRDNFYLDFLPEMVGDDDVIRGPAGDGLVAAVSRDDIAASAAAVLAEPGAHVGMSYALTGPEALTLSMVAETLSSVTGRDVRYHHETVEEAYESRRKWPAPDWQYDAWVSTYTAIAAGEVAEVTHHVLTLTGRPPLSLAELLKGR